MVVGSSYRKLNSRIVANAWGPCDPKQYTAEDSGFGFIRFKNGATVSLESSWALNIRKFSEARCTLCGTEAGADMDDGLHINGERYGRLYEELTELEVGGVDFYDPTLDMTPGEREADAWVQAIIDGKDPVVKPYEALVVTEIIEAIKTSAITGKPVYFDQAAA